MKQYIISLGVFLLLALQAKALSGGDVTRAALFTTYAKQAKQTLLAQKKAMGLNLTGHKFLKEEMEEITDFQKQFNDYLDSFGDILSIAAEAYGIYFEVDQAFKNIRQLKQTSSACPANLIAVAVSERKNNIYTDIVENGIQIAGDIQHLVPLKQDKDQNAKMTTQERIQGMSNVRRSLRALNYKMRKMNRLVSYTTLMDSWFELRGNPKRTRTMTEIVTSSQKRWMQKAISVKHNK